VTLHVAAGECYGLPGPNGAGKSTTAGMLVRPTGGRATVAGLPEADRLSRTASRSGGSVGTVGSCGRGESVGPTVRLAPLVASLLLHEGRDVIYVARQLGHGAELTLRTSGQVIEELEDSPQRPAEDAIRQARARVYGAMYPFGASDADESARATTQHRRPGSAPSWIRTSGLLLSRLGRRLNRWNRRARNAWARPESSAGGNPREAVDSGADVPVCTSVAGDRLGAMHLRWPLRIWARPPLGSRPRFSAWWATPWAWRLRARVRVVCTWRTLSAGPAQPA